MDARGVNPVGLRDIGAFESHGFVMSIRSGSGQSAQVNRPFAKSLQVRVIAVDDTEPVAGGLVTFEAPNTGASLHRNRLTVEIGRNGHAQVSAKANHLGGMYVVTAAASGVQTPALFHLTNRGPAGTAAKSTSAERPTMTVAQPGPKTTPRSDTTNSLSNTSSTTLDWSKGYATLPADLSEYKLNDRGQLSRRSPGGRWTLLATGVVQFEKGANGDLYLLNDQHELKRLQLGTFWSTLQSGVRMFEMSASGSLIVLDHLHHFQTDSFLDRYYILPGSDTPLFQFDIPSPGEVVQAASVSHPGVSESVLDGEIADFPAGPEFPLQRELDVLLSQERLYQSLGNEPSEPFTAPDGPQRWLVNIRIVVEPLVDSVDSPCRIDGVGWVQRHHVRFKATIYGDEVVTHVPSQKILYIDHDHLHLVDPDSVNSPVAATAETTPGATDFAPAVTRPSNHTVGHVKGADIRESLAPLLAKGVDGSIYRLGEIEVGSTLMLSDHSPYNLMRLTPGQNWERLCEVRAMAVAPD